MGIINILPPEIYNKISAGEVVERPQSVVKELIENCIDAGASRVSVTVNGGGIDYIEITDNGCGIAEEDLQSAFFNHATSKFLNISDFDTLSTLGFRGEALASIASVSKVELTTKTPLADTAVKIIVEDGKIIDKQYCSANVGTKIIVKDLFYNTPARKKFLKSPTKEVSEITQYITRLILTNPFLEINYTVNGKNIYDYSGNSLEEAIFAVYGSECLQNCLAINSIYGKTVVKGYVGTPDYTKPNSTYQTASVNGRYIKDVNIATAVKQAFAPYLMTRNYPFFVLHIELPPDEVDVNVHPNKMEVRFANVRQVYYAVSAPIKQALTKYSEQKLSALSSVANSQENDALQNINISDMRIMDVEPTQAPQNFYSDEVAQSIKMRDEQELQKQKKEGCIIYDLNNPDDYKELKEHLDSFDVGKMLKEMEEEERRENERLKQNEPSVDTQWGAFLDLNTNSDYTVFDDGFEIKSLMQKSEEELALEKMKYIGTLFNTYLMIEVDGKVVLIDQHAAHEKILYDKYINDAKTRYTQELLVPYVFKTSHEEGEFLENNIQMLNSAGFVIQPFGNDTFIIKEVCSLFIDTDLKNFVQDLLSLIDNYQLEDEQIFKDKIAQKACKHAVKAGERLTEIQVEYIVSMMLKNKVVQCPHGRPVTKTLTRADLDKMFKRIV